MPHVATITAQLELQLVVPGADSLPLLAGLRYDVTDPWAVTVSFETGDGAVQWLFARQLLTDGIAFPVGEGDIRVWPSLTDGERLVTLAMESPSGSAMFEINRDSLVAFLQQTYLAVPTGHEGADVDLDAELALLLG
jgi:hypothetical protein